MLREYNSGHHYVTLNREFHKDILWWSEFICTYNGVSVIPDIMWSQPDEVFSCDANLTGCGAYVTPRREFESRQGHPCLRVTHTPTV